jgi:pimeloyl-ACP methyl ester carboxylesterase
MPFFTFPDGAQIYYDELGDGPAMLLLHAGWGRYVNWFYSQMEAFPDQRLVIPDRRGYGRSTPVDHLLTDYTTGTMLAICWRCWMDCRLMKPSCGVTRMGR